MKQLLTFKVFTGTDLPAQQIMSELPALRWQAIVLRKLTWLVMIAYVIMLGKPVVPIVKDAIAHTFWEQQHMLVVHEENGKFHVHHETVKASGQSDKEKSSGNVKVEIEDNLYVISELAGCHSVIKFTSLVSHPAYHCHYKSCGQYMHYPPPKV